MVRVGVKFHVLGLTFHVTDPFPFGTSPNLWEELKVSSFWFKIFYQRDCTDGTDGLDSGVCCSTENINGIIFVRGIAYWRQMSQQQLQESNLKHGILSKVCLIC